MVLDPDYKPIISAVNVSLGFDDWPNKTQSGSDNNDGEDKNDAKDDVNGADYEEGLSILVDPKRI